MVASLVADNPFSRSMGFDWNWVRGSCTQFDEGLSQVPFSVIETKGRRDQPSLAVCRETTPEIASSCNVQKRPQSGR